MILPLFGELFEESLGLSHTIQVIDNRFNLYFRLFANGGVESTNQMRFYFTELAKRRNSKPVPHDFQGDFPLMLVGIMEEVGIAVDWASSVVNMLEPLCTTFDYFYHAP